MSTVWMVQPATETPVERSIVSEDWVLRQKLLPSGLFRLDGDVASVTGGATSFKRDMQLIEITTEEAIVACDAVSHREKLIGHNQFCLIDYDRDARFDGIFAVQNISKGGGLPTVQGRYPKKAKAISPVAYSRIQPTELTGEYFVGVQFAGKAALYDKLNFQICYGSSSASDCLSGGSSSSASIFPAQQELMGSRFTVISRGSGSVKVRIDSMIPPQPFGIVSTTTYRFY